MGFAESLSAIDCLSESERNVATFIAQNADNIIHYSIQEVAAQSFTSTTTVLRLCKKLGFNGFKELKAKLALDSKVRLAKETGVDVNVPFDERDSKITIASKIAGLTRDTINSCLLYLNEDSLSKAIDLLIEAENILAIGVSDSFIRLIDFQNKMLKIDAYVKITYFQPDQVYLCANATNRDVALIVSYSGTTAEVVNEAKILHERRVPMVAITSRPESLVGQYAQVVIQVPADEQESIANYSLSSQIAIEYTLNTLFSCIYATHYNERKGHLLTGRKCYLHK